MFLENSASSELVASRYELFNASFHWLIIDKKASSTNDDEAPDGTGPDRLQRGQWRNCRRRSQVPPLFGRGPPAVSGGNNGSFCSDDGDEDTTTLDRLETMNISINAEITLVRESSVAGGATANGDRRRKVYALFDIWNPGFISGGQLNVTAMGNYVVDNAGGGRLTVWFHQSTVVRRRDMRGLKLKMMTVVTQRPGIPFEVYLATPNNTHLDSVHRYNFGLMSYIRDYFNFR
ncbi:ionotropic glutamate receptor-invertebrate [Culex quinquefasciatus]|uniref:Ionotropic glutamate receptor-invertebrate n=1 Tax=Culex quinquefasciatus TaxID=7176 RepID=B0WT90_CULQU|nr:ionotropic glutamate receptor-invertebrate [Culex quinquefasciatus]|eukprot:XP_001870847.1 ionotropic glutamate receptor-invertebrate [Culex quinquefasciatus]